jgi:hypothetical protein
LEAIQEQVVILLTTLSSDVSAIVDILNAARNDTDATVTVAADGSEHYTFSGGESINFATDGSIIASAINEGLYGTFNTDGTWSIQMHNDCMSLSYDGTDVVVAEMASCTVGSDTTDLMSLVTMEIDAIMNNGATVDGLIAIFYAAAPQADYTEELVDGSTMYSW